MPEWNCIQRDRNRISRPTQRVSWHHTTKPTGSVAEVNAAVAPESNAFLPGETPDREIRIGESAEAIVVMKSVKTDGAKGQTEQERSDRLADAVDIAADG